MAFQPRALSRFAASSRRPRERSHTYVYSTEDSASEVAASGYFSGALERFRLRAGDVIDVTASAIGTPAKVILTVVSIATGVVLTSPGGAAVPDVVYIPPGLGFDLTSFPLTITLNDPGGDAAASATVDVTPEAVFDAKSTARSNPANRYYFGTGGADANDGLTVATRKLTLGGAIQAGNTAGGSMQCIPNDEEAFRAIGSTAVLPTQDIAIIPPAGKRFNSGVFDTFTTALDTTNTNCYVVTIGAVDRVTNRLVQNSYGSNRDYAVFATAAALNSATLTTADGYAYESGKLYMRRLDGAQPTPANTRVNRSTVPFFRVTADINVWVERVDGEGGIVGVFEYTQSAARATKRVCIFKDCSAKYGGGNVHTGSRGFSLDSINGLIWLVGCTANANATDGINGHDQQANGTNVLATNCVGNDNGRGTAASCNGFTFHESAKAIDAAGQYLGNHGGSVRHVNNAKVLCAGTMSTDLGDLATPSANAAFQVDDGGTAELWCYKTKAPNAAGRTAYLAGGSSKIHQRSVAATAGTSGGSGTIDTY